MKKQIVFIEALPKTYTLRIARTLKLTGRYETALVSFAKVNREDYGRGFDRIIEFEISHKINPKNLILFLKKITGKKFRIFLKELRKLNPYIFQITGPDLFTMISMFIIKKKPKVYYAPDIWQGATSRLFIKGYPNIKAIFQEIFERICFKKADGIINMSSPEEFMKIGYKLRAPKISFVPGCMDEWISLPKKKKNKEIHMVYSSGPLAEHEGRVPFIEVVKSITSQKIHLHTYGPCIDKKDNVIFEKEAENNKYFHFHVNERPKNELLKEYDYGIVPDFYFGDVIKPISLRNEMANKFFKYIEAGIPVIMTKNFGVMAQIVEENKIGMAVNFGELKNIKDKLAKKNYSQLQKSIKKAQEKFKLSRNIWKLERFYEKITNNSKER